MKKVALIIAHQGYQQVEYGIPKEILTNAGVKVVTVSDEPGIATAKDSSTTEVDLTIDQVNPEDFDGIFLIGGPGALDCLDNETIHKLLNKLNDSDKVFGAICISPRILAKAGVLDDKNATGWNGDGKINEIFEAHNVNYLPVHVVVDQKTITASGPEAAEEFAQAILRLINK